MRQNTFNKKHTGFTLLFTSLIVSLILAIGLAILNITLQQLLLSSSGRESQFAFYNADSGIECALYYDRNKVGHKSFATSSESVDTYEEGAISCGGMPVDHLQVSTGPDFATTYFDVVLDPTPDLSQCPQDDGTRGETFSIKVKKYIANDSQGNPGAATTIESRGYNTCKLTNPRRVERGLLVNY